jgi:hypothetical protein
MRIILTEEQLTIIKEQVNMRYTPERVDQFVQEGEKYLNMGTDLFRKYYHNVMSTTIGDVSDRMDEVKLLINKLEQTKEVLGQKMDLYYKVVEMYDDDDEYPDNVKRLEKIKDEIDDIRMDIDEIKDGFNCLLSSAEYLIKLNNRDKI